MIATIIPYFLLATVPNDSTWPTGPEFKFDSKVVIKIKGLKDTNIRNGFDFYNQLACRPKTETSVNCKFLHKNMTVKDVDEETGEIKSEQTVADLQTPFYFEVGFDKKGVKEITLNEESSKYEPAIGIAKAMANALNVGTDLSEVRLDNNPESHRVVENVILEKCKGEIIGVLKSSPSEKNFSDGNWSLALVPPLANLEARNFLVMKNWNTTDCKSAIKFFWLGMFLGPAELRRSSDTAMNFTNIGDTMTVSPGMFISASEVRVDVFNRGKKFELQEMSTIHLNDIQPAVESWPAIENPVTLVLNEEK